MSTSKVREDTPVIVWVPPKTDPETTAELEVVHKRHWERGAGKLGSGGGGQSKDAYPSSERILKPNTAQGALGGSAEHTQ